MTIERLLRVAALIIAVLALIDPMLTFASRQRPVVALSVVGSPSLARAVSGSETAADLARRVRAQVAGALADAFEVREGPVAEAAAQVLIGDGSFPAETPLVANVPLVAVAIDNAPAPNVRVLRVEAPARAQITARLRVRAIVEARGMEGRTSTITLRADDLEMARVTHAWTKPIEGATIALEAMPFRTGLARLTVTAEPDAVEATAADNSAETATDVTNDKIRVLFVEARPSWMTRFARQALDADERFDIRTLSRVSRGLTAATPDTPQTLTPASLDPFAAVIVGAADALTRADVDALRDFARRRGGVVIFAPDQQPAGPYVDLLPARTFDERQQEEPSAIHLNLAENAGSTSASEQATTGESRATANRAAVAGADATTGESTAGASRGTSHGDAMSGDAATGFAASELALPHQLLPGAEVLGRVGDARTGAAVIVSSPAGDGEVVFIGALDAWRFRAAGASTDAAAAVASSSGASGRAGGSHAASAGSDANVTAFDTTWRQLVAMLGARVAAPIAVALDAPVVAPGGRLGMRLRLRRTLVQADGTVPPLVAELSGPGGGGAGETAGAGETSTVRLWPGDQAGGLTSVINAPSRTGVYAVSVGFTRGVPLGRATLLVASTAPVAAVSWDGLRTFVDAHGGALFTSADIPRLIAHLQQRVHASTLPRARHPFRSAWWLAPFAACLGGEWWLRRRRGQR